MAILKIISNLILCMYDIFPWCFGPVVSPCLMYLETRSGVTSHSATPPPLPLGLISSGGVTSGCRLSFDWRLQRRRLFILFSAVTADSHIPLPSIPLHRGPGPSWHYIPYPYCNPPSTFVIAVLVHFLECHGLEFWSWQFLVHSRQF